MGRSLLHHAYAPRVPKGTAILGKILASLFEGGAPQGRWELEKVLPHPLYPRRNSGGGMNYYKRRLRAKGGRKQTPFKCRGALRGNSLDLVITRRLPAEGDKRWGGRLA